jgi:hypothetical protein
VTIPSCLTPVQTQLTDGRDCLSLSYGLYYSNTVSDTISTNKSSDKIPMSKQ